MLELAVRCDARSRAVALLAHGASPNGWRDRRSGFGHTALHVAVVGGLPEVKVKPPLRPASGALPLGRDTSLRRSVELEGENGPTTMMRGDGSLAVCVV